MADTTRPATRRRARIARHAWVGLSLAAAVSCTLLPPRIGTVPGPDVETRPAAEESETPDAGPGPDAGDEALEDPEALAALIAEQSRAIPESPADHGEAAAAAPRSRALTAFEISGLSAEECRARLEDAGVKTRKPAIETPGVETPLVLDGPIHGVAIRPRWPRTTAENEVVDCRLVVALAHVAEVARDLGVKEILFYSTYRPPRKGRAGGRGQHGRGLAIDARWFVLEDGRTLDVLEHYERHDREPPCADRPETDEGRLLQAFACRLHEDRTFNVVLTPNANRAHHNHFHLDITPGARWYIVR